MFPFELLEKIANFDFYTFGLMRKTCMKLSKIDDTNVILRNIKNLNENRDDFHDLVLPNGVLHSIDDLPAEVFAGTLTWYKYGKIHRDNDMPSVVSDEKLVWYYNGQIHRYGDKPALCYTFIRNAHVEYYKYGELYRQDDLPSVICGGFKFWFTAGKLYRKKNRPVIVSLDDSIQWRLNEVNDIVYVTNYHIDTRTGIPKLLIDLGIHHWYHWRFYKKDGRIYECDY